MKPVQHLCTATLLFSSPLLLSSPPLPFPHSISPSLLHSSLLLLYHSPTFLLAFLLCFSSTLLLAFCVSPPSLCSAYLHCSSPLLLSSTFLFHLSVAPFSKSFSPSRFRSLQWQGFEYKAVRSTDTQGSSQQGLPFDIFISLFSQHLCPWLLTLPALTSNMFRALLLGV